MTATETEVKKGITPRVIDVVKRHFCVVPKGYYYHYINMGLMEREDEVEIGFFVPKCFMRIDRIPENIIEEDREYDYVETVCGKPHVLLEVETKDYRARIAEDYFEKNNRIGVAYFVEIRTVVSKANNIPEYLEKLFTILKQL